MYHLLVWFGVGPLALSGFLDVLGRQPSDGGRVLMVAPLVSDRLLDVKLSPHVSVGTVVVEMMLSYETSVHTHTHTQSKKDSFVFRRTGNRKQSVLLPGVLVIRSGLSAELFAGIFVSLKHRLLPTDVAGTLAAASFLICHEVQIFLLEL